MPHLRTLLLLLTACDWGTPPPPSPPAHVTPPPVAPVEPPVDQPDLSGSWVYRGLTPFPAPNLYTWDQIERTALSGGRYSVRSVQELRSADRGARLGEVRRTGTTAFRNKQACTTWTSVDFKLEPWLDTLPLRDTVLRRYDVRSEECVPVERYAPDRVDYVKGSIRWAEARKVVDWRAPPGSPADGRPPL